MLINTYVPTFWLEIASDLRAHSISLVYMATINGKQLHTLAWRCVKEETLSTLKELKFRVIHEGIKRQQISKKGTWKKRINFPAKCVNI